MKIGELSKLELALKSSAALSSALTDHLATRMRPWEEALGKAALSPDTSLGRAFETIKAAQLAFGPKALELHAGLEAARSTWLPHAVALDSAWRSSQAFQALESAQSLVEKALSPSLVVAAHLKSAAESILRDLPPAWDDNLEEKLEAILSSVELPDDDAEHASLDRDRAVLEALQLAVSTQSSTVPILSSRDQVMALALVFEAIYIAAQNPSERLSSILAGIVMLLLAQWGTMKDDDQK